MTTDSARRKLELAVERELERAARGRDMENRARRNLERGQRNVEGGRRRAQHFQERIRDRDAVVAAAEKLP